MYNVAYDDGDDDVLNEGLVVTHVSVECIRSKKIAALYFYIANKAQN